MSAKRERLAVVTGGIGGLGTEICRHLARSGRKVVAADLDARPERIDAFRESVSEFNGHIRFEPLNVADFDHCAEFAERVQQHHGAVDILVNAAGITRDTTLRKMDAKQWSDVIRVNLDGVFNLSRQFVDGMCERGFGRIVNIGSIHSLVASPFKSAYIAAKHGLIGLSKTLALENGDVDITVNTICPVYVRTPLVEKQIEAQAREHGLTPERVVSDIMLKPMPKKAFVTVAEIAALTGYLISDAARNVTAQAIAIDGGWTAQ